MEPKAEISLTIDGREVSAPEGATILEAARLNNIRIPTLCHHDALTPWGGCRLCVVEVDGAPKLAASCVMPVRNGMEVVTKNERIIEARRTILEFLFSERNHFCMFCAQSGDCELQDLAYEYQMDHLTVPSLDDNFPVDSTHPDMVMDHNRCVLCGRCVRACRELAGASVLDFHNRGGQTLIGVDLSKDLAGSSCVSCGACLQVCPTGAIFQRHRTHYAVKGKSKDWTTVDSFCPECGFLCPTVSYVKDNNVLKIEGVLDSDGLDRGQLCARGRFGPLMSPAPRLLWPMVKGGDGKWERVDLDKALKKTAEGLSSVGKAHGAKAVWGVISSGCSNEEMEHFKELVGSNGKAAGVESLDGDIFRAIAAAREGNKGSVKEASLKAILEADFILAVEADAEKTQPLIRSFVRRAVYENKAKLAVVNCEKDLGSLAHVQLTVAEGDLASLINELRAEAAQDKAAKVPQDFLKRLGDQPLAELINAFKNSRNPIIIAGSAALKELVALAESRKKASKENLPLIILKPWGNSAGAWALGMASREGIGEAGQVKGCFMCLSEENGLGSGLAESLDGLDFLAVLTPYFTDALAEKAQVLIPKPTWLEADGTYTFSDGSGTRLKKKVLKPPVGVSPVQETLAALAGRWS